ncbi:MAG TPA: GNAT family N-acetyltransferase [Mycobacteriales bacterium]|nr:GNAT family N-acetyltransferase [Mycobacteriales bacterium]
MTTDSAQESVVRLRRYRSEDAGWYAETVRDAEIQRFTSDRDDLTAEDVERAIAESAADPHREAFLICGANNSERLGNLAIDVGDGIADLSYWVAPDARGRGVAAKAIALACAWLETHSDVRTAMLWTVEDNVASRKAAERAGFHMVRTGQRTLRARQVATAEYEQVLGRADNVQ